MYTIDRLVYLCFLAAVTIVPLLAGGVAGGWILTSVVDYYDPRNHPTLGFYVALVGTALGSGLLFDRLSRWAFFDVGDWVIITPGVYGVIQRTDAWLGVCEVCVFGSTRGPIPMQSLTLKRMDTNSVVRLLSFELDRVWTRVRALQNDVDDLRNEIPHS